MPTTNSFVIETNDLSKSYKKVPVLKSFNLKVPQNSIFGFLGPNGAGKTTTIKLLLGLIRPTGGSATVFGQDIVKDSINIREQVGYLPQEPRFYDYMSARETLRFTLRFFNKGSKAALEERINETLALVGLEDKAERPIKGFSGGERQRLGIAQAQVNHPDLLILDEPAANLDPQGRRDVLDVMERLRDHTSIFYSTHILDDVQRVSDYVAILNHGQLVTQARIEDLLQGDDEGIIYDLATKGNHETAYNRLTTLPWVSGVDLTPVNGITKWQVQVNDEQTAEAQLLRSLLLDEHLTVTEFGRKTYNLEEVFLNITSGVDNVKQ